MRTWRLVLIPVIMVIALSFVGVILVAAGTPASYSDAPTDPQAALTITVNYATDWVSGLTGPNATVVVTVTNQLGAIKEITAVTADGAGDFFVTCEDWLSGACPDIQPGDGVFVLAGGIQAEVNPVGTVTGRLDADKDTVTGNLYVGNITGTLEVVGEVWAPGSPTINAAVNTAGGSFTFDFGNAGWDLQIGDVVALSYFEPDGDRVINQPAWPWTRVNYAHDWVGVNYEIGHTFWMTVTDSLGSVKATTSAGTFSNGGWAGPGFDVDTWQPDRPDIQPGDFVYFTADDGYQNTLQVGQISGQLDLSVDTLSGTVIASEFFQPLSVECHPWGAWQAGLNDVPIKQSMANPDGSSAYLCDWGAATEWDIQPGQDVGVMYIEPDLDRVIDVYREPAPYLQLDLQAFGAASNAGNFLFQVDYWNQGDAPAENVVITDTLTGGMNYLSDTSPFSHTGGGSGPIVWNLGTVGPGMQGSFNVYVEITAPESETITNTVQIATTSPTDQGQPWEKSALWVGIVSEADADLQVTKGAWTNDPVPGGDLVFWLNVCNQGTTASSQVILTDTLPAMVPLDTWWALQAGWTEIQRAPDELVLSIPTVTGAACMEVNLKTHLSTDLPVGQTLTNTATIAVENDPVKDDNQVSWAFQTGQPHTNLRIDKWWNGGRLTPGGELRYAISYQNTGNVAVGAFRITDTLPAGTTFLSAWHDDSWGGFSFPPVMANDEVVVWEIPSLENGYQGQFEVRLAVPYTAVPGSLLLNTVEISPLPGEDTFLDNQASAVETLQPAGPNLRVAKWHNWAGDNRLVYQLRFENLGDETISNVWITDTLPLGAAWNGSLDLVFEGDRLITYDYMIGTRTLIWLFSELRPGESGWLSFGADLDDPGVPARWYTNTVEITTPPGDTNPGDNFYQDVAFSGGEIEQVGFWLEDDGSSAVWGQAIAGSVITMTTPSSIFVAFADPDCGGCWLVEEAGPLFPGDQVEVVAGQGLLPVVVTIPDPFTAFVDTSADRVSGQIGDWIERPVEIFGQWPGGYRVVASDAGGGYSGAFGDIPPGSGGYVQVIDQVNYAEVIFQRPFQALDLLFNVNYGHDWIDGSYPLGHTIWITATGSDGSTVKGTAELESVDIPEGNGETGFSTLWGGWSGERPDLQPGDWVFGRTDNGDTAAVRIGDITIQVDAAANLISGQLQAGWLSGPLPIACEVWESALAPSIQTTVDPQGGSYQCDFGAVGWDILPYQMIAVRYADPGGHTVINMMKWPRIIANLGPLSGGNRHVWGEGATPNTSVHVTVLNDLNSLIAETTVQADSAGNFDTGESLPVNSLADGYKVAVDFGNVMNQTLEIYPLVGQADPQTDQVIINAEGSPDFTLSLEYCWQDRCHWVDLGQIGSGGHVTVDLMDIRGFDIQPGASFHAHLYTLNGHEVIYSWGLPAEIRLYLPVVENE